MKYTTKDITVIILAGGQGTRFNNQNKGLIDINGESFISLLLKKLAPQSKTQIISVNDNISAYEKYGKTLVKDQVNHYQGPLSGILSCKALIDTPLVLVVPCDSPMIPQDLAARLLTTYNQLSTTLLCVAHDGDRLQNLFMLFDTTLLSNMQQYFLSEKRSVYSWIKQQPYQPVDFSDKAAHFTNVNNEENLNTLKQLIASNKIKP